MTQMSGLHRFLLFLPIPGALFFGLAPLLVPAQLARSLGYSGDDPYLTRLAGAATLGYAVALAFGVWRGNWLEVRFVVVATLVYSLTALYACAVAFASGVAQPVVWLIVANSLMELAVCGWLLFRFRQAPGGAANIPKSGVALVIVATAAALVTGVPALLLPQPVGHLLGYRVTDTIILTLAGASTCGYAAMGALELRSQRWAEMRLPVLMAMIFQRRRSARHGGELSGGWSNSASGGCSVGDNCCDSGRDHRVAPFRSRRIQTSAWYRRIEFWRVGSLIVTSPRQGPAGALCRFKTARGGAPYV